jgi:hypothetical protein
MICCYHNQLFTGFKVQLGSGLNHIVRIENREMQIITLTYDKIWSATRINTLTSVFLTYINDLPLTIKSQSKSEIFADTSVIILRQETDEFQSYFNDLFTRFIKWFEVHNLHHNTVFEHPVVISWFSIYRVLQHIDQTSRACSTGHLEQNMSDKLYVILTPLLS